MILTHRRVALIYACLAGMEAAWFAPFWLLVFGQNAAPLAVWAGATAALLAWTVALELLSRTRLESPAYEAAALGLMLLTSAGILLVSTGGRPLTAFRYGVGFQPALALVGGNLFLWQRATSATSRDISFFKVGMSFRVGLLLLIAFGGLASYLDGLHLLPLLWIYFALGLVAVGLARIHEKAEDAQSAGAPLPGRRLAQLLLVTAATVGGMGLLSEVYTPAGIRAFLHWFDPLWRVLGALLTVLMVVLGWLLNPLLMWLEARLADLLRDQRFDELLGFLTPGVAESEEGLLTRLPAWARVALADLALGLFILVVAVVVLGFLLLYLERVRRNTARRSEEDADAEPATFGGGLLGRGWQALRDLAGLARRYGLSRQLLAAISVQNLYANLCRLARLRGHGRRPAQPPDDYLPTLARAFTGQEEPLARLTAAYMRVHYGDHTVTAAELAALRADYRAVRAAEPPAP